MSKGAQKWQHVFWGKFKFREKKSLKGQKWPQNRVFTLLKKIKSLFLSGNNQKMKGLVVLFCGYAKITYPGQFLFLGYGQKYSSPIRFEYSLILNV